MPKVQCPHCHTPVEWSETALYRPFCSQRCRLIDLGAWADGSYTLPLEDPLVSPPTAPTEETEW